MLKKAILGLLIAGMILLSGCDFIQSYGFKTHVTGVSQSVFDNTVTVSFTVENTGVKDIRNFGGTIDVTADGWLYSDSFFTGDIRAGDIVSDYATINVGLNTYGANVNDMVEFSEYTFDTEETDTADF